MYKLGILRLFFLLRHSSTAAHAESCIFRNTCAAGRAYDAASLVCHVFLAVCNLFFQIGDIFADAGKILVECFAVQIAVVDDQSDILVILLNLILKRMLTGADLLNFYEFICFLSHSIHCFFQCFT